MNDPRPATVGSVLDAYRADAAEREVLLRTLEKQNYTLISRNATYLGFILGHKQREWFAYFLGALSGACLMGASAAIDRGDREALVVWGSLAMVFIGMRAIWSIAVPGKLP